MNEIVNSFFENYTDHEFKNNFQHGISKSQT